MGARFQEAGGGSPPPPPPLLRSPPSLPPLLRSPPSLPPLLFILLLMSTADALDVVDQEPELNCSEGLTDCLVTEETYYRPPYEERELTADVGSVQLKVLLCCSHSRGCEPCLQILIAIQGVDGEREKQDSQPSGERGSEEGLPVRPQEGSGASEPSNATAVVRVCLSSPGVGYCKAVEFRPHRRLQNHVPEHKLWLVLTEAVVFGGPVEVQVHARSTSVFNLTVPSLQEVCYLNPNANVKDCQAPRLQVVADGETDEILLRLDVTDAYSQTVLLQKFWNQIPGEVVEWPKGQREIHFGTHAVAPCLCFQVWWKGKPLRRESCPFKNLKGIIENMQNNVSVSMSVAPVRNNHGNTPEAPGLSWNVSAPCRLEGEVWLCKKDSAGCEEVTGSRQSLSNHTKAGWRATAKGHWKEGQFMNMSPHPTLCIQVMLHGSHSSMEPRCPFAAPRWRWGTLAIISLLLLCLSILGAYFVQGLLKGYAWRWFKEGNVKGLVAGSHVVLLHQADGQQALPALLSRLGSSLQSLGFSVSLDLWSHTELSVLGPVPWLHSQLDRVQRQGGKVVLVLTHTAWSTADEWGGQGWERGGARRSREEGEEEEEEEEEGGKVSPVSSKHVDAFSASLSCVLADYMQGRAGERFLLVQFESLPPQAAGSTRPLPELFRGLHLHCLPSQSLAFLTELAGGRSASSASARRKKAGRLRVGSRVLARGLTGAGATMLRLAGLPPPQDCVGKAEEEDTWETVPLQPYAPTPPSSPDTDPKGWV